MLCWLGPGGPRERGGTWGSVPRRCFAPPRLRQGIARQRLRRTVPLRPSQPLSLSSRPRCCRVVSLPCLQRACLSPPTGGGEGGADAALAAAWRSGGPPGGSAAVPAAAERGRKPCQAVRTAKLFCVGVFVNNPNTFPGGCPLAGGAPWARALSLWAAEAGRPRPGHPGGERHDHGAQAAAAAPPPTGVGRTNGDGVGQP